MVRPPGKAHSAHGKKIAAGRQERQAKFWGGKKFEYVQPIALPDNQRFVDPSGNKGKRGFLIRQVDPPIECICLGVPDPKCQAEWIVGWITLQNGRKLGAIKVPNHVKAHTAITATQVTRSGGPTG